MYSILYIFWYDHKALFVCLWSTVTLGTNSCATVILVDILNNNIVPIVILSC